MDMAGFDLGRLRRHAIRLAALRLATDRRDMPSGNSRRSFCMTMSHVVPNSYVERPHPSSNKWVRKGHCARRKYRNAVLALFAPADSSQDRAVRAAEQRRRNRCLAQKDWQGATATAP